MEWVHGGRENLLPILNAHGVVGGDWRVTAEQKLPCFSDEIVAQLAISENCFWIASADGATGRISPTALKGATGRILLVVDDPEVVVRSAVTAGASVASSTPSATSGKSAGR